MREQSERLLGTADGYDLNCRSHAFRAHINGAIRVFRVIQVIQVIRVVRVIRVIRIIRIYNTRLLHHAIIGIGSTSRVHSHRVIRVY